jgi:hypothetical protein
MNLSGQRLPLPALSSPGGEGRKLRLSPGLGFEARRYAFRELSLKKRAKPGRGGGEPRVTPGCQSGLLQSIRRRLRLGAIPVPQTAGAFDFLTEPEGGQDNPEKDRSQQEPRPAIATGGRGRGWAGHFFGHCGQSISQACAGTIAFPGLALPAGKWETGAASDDYQAFT